MADRFYHLDCWPFVLASQGQQRGTLLRDEHSEQIAAVRQQQSSPPILKHPWLNS
ncbi:MAG: hypothetical protein IGS03_09630 [Candidatus Sericytochromatia bacterium]|nr:hypothetical protein [Candidatus Sericytochromatia bacterium]